MLQRFTQPVSEMSIWLVSKVDNLTTICEPVVLLVSNVDHLTTICEPVVLLVSNVDNLTTICEPVVLENVTSSTSHNPISLSTACCTDKSATVIRERTIPTDLPQLVGEVSANLCEEKGMRGQRGGFLRA
jgi:hypothetical protein